MSNFRILVAVDLETGTARLLAEAERYARALDAIVSLVHVADPDPDFAGYIKGAPESQTAAPGAPDYDQMLRDDRAKNFRLEHRQLHALAEKMRSTGIRIGKALTVQGPTMETILEEARKLDTELLILGSHQHGALYRAWYGDVALDVARQAPCAVLVVPILPDANPA